MNGSLNESSIILYFLNSLHTVWLMVHDLILVLNCDSSVSSLSDQGISSHINGGNDEGLS